MHPASVTPSTNNSGPAHVRQMAADFGLIGFQDLHKEADAYLITPH
jgi:hypothetical protein